jgi:sugar/nucleoside kinase (ribokinase family)
MAVTVVGSVAFDSISSPFGRAEHELGGSAVHAALAASVFTDVALVGPVGDDFGPEHHGVLEHAGVDTSGIEHFAGASTFSWRGRYEFDMVARTEETRLNVFDGWRPRLPAAAQQSDILFLASMDPETQLDVREQWSGGKWSALDTMDYWIDHGKSALVEAIHGVDIVLMNDLEARALTRQPMLLRAARELMSWGPLAVVLRLGEYGCALLTDEGWFSLPGYPLEDAADPTGCGDAFAGGFLGYLDLVPGSALTSEVLRRAVIYGSVMASYCFEDFGVRRIAALSEHEVNYRFDDFKTMTHFEHVPTRQRPHGTGEGEAEVHQLPHPGLTPSTQPHRAPGRTAGTQTPAAPGRTPSTESLPRPVRPESARIPSSIPHHHPLRDDSGAA